MEPQSSLPHSQAPATCPYPEPTPSSPDNPFSLLKIHLNIILPSTSWSPQWSLYPRFPTKTLCTPLPSAIRATCAAHLILLDSVNRLLLLLLLLYCFCFVLLCSAFVYMYCCFVCVCLCAGLIIGTCAVKPAF